MDDISGGMQWVWYCPKCNETRGTDHNGPTPCRNCKGEIKAISAYSNHLEVGAERDALKAKLKIAVEALVDIAKEGGPCGHIAEAAVKEITDTRSEGGRR